MLASSGGSRARRLSRRDRTLRLAQPPISAGSAVSRFRSTFRFVSLASLPRDLGKAWEGTKSVVARGKGSTGKRHKARSGEQAAFCPNRHVWDNVLGTSLGQVFPQAHRLIHANSFLQYSTAHSNHHRSSFLFCLSVHSQPLCFTNQITGSLEQGHFQSHYPKLLTSAACDVFLDLSVEVVFGTGNPSIPAIPENV